MFCLCVYVCVCVCVATGPAAIMHGVHHRTAATVDCTGLHPLNNMQVNVENLPAYTIQSTAGIKREVGQD